MSRVSNYSWILYLIINYLLELVTVTIYILIQLVTISWLVFDDMNSSIGDHAWVLNSSIGLADILDFMDVFWWQTCMEHYLFTPS